MKTIPFDLQKAIAVDWKNVRLRNGERLAWVRYVPEDRNWCIIGGHDSSPYPTSWRANGKSLSGKGDNWDLVLVVNTITLPERWELVFKDSHGYTVPTRQDAVAQCRFFPEAIYIKHHPAEEVEV